MTEQNSYVREYTCAACGGTFLEGRSDEEAQRECLENWGVRADSNVIPMDVICDDCYRKIMVWMSKPGVAN